ncbi:cell wall proline rich protein [Apiospora aurea]|uniref:Cell wall proline rich protein n=1 Tax=Apiospora aurea TaxID=335848 RepID=A0ABR1QDW9_9PEZI
MDSTVVGAVGALGGLDIDSSESRHLALPSPLALDGRRASDSTLASPQPSPRTALPPPNPPFVFPSRGLPSSAPSSFPRASGQRPRSAIDLNQKTFDLSGVPADTGSWGRSTRRSPALPDFSFNPGSSLSPNSAATSRSPRSPSFDFSFHPSSSLSASENAPSPPVSPGQPTPNRGGHKRGGSEFVGGHIRNGNSITVTNISPTKSESGLATPTLAPVDSSTAQRRGRHAHRRSAAISSHDLSMILKPASPNISGDSSAPSTPAHVEENAKATNDSAATDETKPVSAEPADSADINGGASDKQLAEAPELFTEKSTPRTRVGFSDNVEFIPRPLSLVSTDTTSTVTARPGHSVSNSISSIISMSNSITQEREQVSLRTSPQYGAASESKVDSRPSTAGAVLERTPSLHALAVAESSTSPRRRNSIPLLNNLTVAGSDMPAVPSPSKTPKRWSFFGLESLGLAGSPTKPRPHSSSSAETAPKDSSTTASSTDNITTEGAYDLISTQPDKKVKAWAGSILTRKTKPRLKSKSGRRHSMTPPPPPKLDLSDDEDEDMADVTNQPATAPTVMVTGPAADPAFADSSFKAEDDPSFPMIDLDAALGPFNTPSSLDPAWEAAQRAGAPPKRQLHSAAGLRGFSGPGMHYHRRTESAPEMPPFEGARFGIHRFGSSSTMADVFEEEEEDDDDSGSDESTPDASGASIADADVHSASDNASTPTQEVEASLKSSNDSASVTPSVERKGSGSSLEMLPIPSRLRSDTSSNSLHDDIIAEEAPVHNAADQERIYETIFGSSDSAAPSPRRILTSKDSGSSDVNSMRLPAPLLTPLSPFSMSHSSMASPRSPMSFDGHRVSTAPSSVVDDSQRLSTAPSLGENNDFQSLLMGEPGPEVVRISIDVPSLTSSNSTMTRESNFPGVRPRSTPFHDQRPASFTSSAFGRRRSSLASLSRLINSAHGERSKLSMEVPADNEPDKKQKSSKTKRLSKMMQFWKPKESTRA